MYLPAQLWLPRQIAPLDKRLRNREQCSIVAPGFKISSMSSCIKHLMLLCRQSPRFVAFFLRYKYRGPHGRLLLSLVNQRLLARFDKLRTWDRT